MKKKYLFPFWTVFLVLIHLITSCSSEDQPLTNEELKIVDSIFRKKEQSLMPSLDTLCDSVYKKTYPKMVDSIKKLRQEEVIKLLKE